METTLSTKYRCGPKTAPKNSPLKTNKTSLPGELDIEMGTTISDSHCNNEESAGAVDTWLGYYSGFREGFLEMVLPPVRLDGPGRVTRQREAGCAFHPEVPAHTRAPKCAVLEGQAEVPRRRVGVLVQRYVAGGGPECSGYHPEWV